MYLFPLDEKCKQLLWFCNSVATQITDSIIVIACKLMYCFLHKWSGLQLFRPFPIFHWNPAGNILTYRWCRKYIIIKKYRKYTKDLQRMFTFYLSNSLVKKVTIVGSVCWLLQGQGHGANEWQDPALKLGLSDPSHVDNALSFSVLPGEPPSLPWTPINQ